MTFLKSFDSFVFQVRPACFLLRRDIPMRPLVNRTPIKRHNQQGSHFGRIIAIPDYFQESSKPGKHAAKMALKGFERRASTREELRRENLRQLMLLDSARPSKLIFVHPKTSQQLTRVPQTDEPKPAVRGYRLNFKQPWTWQEKINPDKVLMKHYKHPKSLSATTTENHNEIVTAVTEDVVVKASFSASLTTSPDALLKTIRDICESLLNIFLSSTFPHFLPKI